MTIKPYPTAQNLSADTIAECTEGLSKLAYGELWNVVVPRMQPLNKEDFGSPGEYYAQKKSGAPKRPAPWTVGLADQFDVRCETVFPTAV